MVEFRFSHLFCSSAAGTISARSYPPGYSKAGSEPISTLGPVSARTFAIFVAVLAVIALLGFGIVSKDDDALAVGEPLPADELPTLAGSRTASIDDYAGKWVLVNVWASWCDPCREEAPVLERFYRRHRDGGFVVLGVDSQDASEDALAFAKQFGLTYPQLHDGSGDYAKDRLNTTGVPENFLVDPDGEVALVQRGPVDAEILERDVAPLIEGG
jgi:cytochrome c biogenesis protein CcmG/thiol:disulfide interchange protein DsbE